MKATQAHGWRDILEMIEMRDEFLSEEDLDFRNMTEKELLAYWNFWLRQAEATNDLDKHTYSHGVFHPRTGRRAAGGHVTMRTLE